MHCILQPFGRFQKKLDIDMVFGPPIPQLLVTPTPTDEQSFIRVLLQLVTPGYQQKMFRTSSLTMVMLQLPQQQLDKFLVLVSFVVTTHVHFFVFIQSHFVQDPLCCYFIYFLSYPFFGLQRSVGLRGLSSKCYQPLMKIMIIKKGNCYCNFNSVIITLLS